MMVVCLRALLAQLRERPTLWTHLFPLMFYRDLSLALTMFLLLHYGFEYLLVSYDSIFIFVPHSPHSIDIGYKL